jgi:hypothetical protein
MTSINQHSKVAGMDEKQKPGQPGQQNQGASFLYALKAVFWSFFGLRRKRDFDTDSARLNPVHFIVAGLIGVALFIGLLLTIVKFVVSK